jgi:isoleucyl-tRNA synthetase
MEAYRLYTVTPKLLGFIEALTNWYVRMNRKRLKGGDGEADAVGGVQFPLLHNRVNVRHCVIMACVHRRCHTSRCMVPL